MLTLIFIFAYLSISMLTLGDYSFNKINFKKFWQKSFDFKGTIKRGDFWITQGWLFFHSILLVILVIVLSVDITGFGFSFIEIRVTSIFFLIKNSRINFVLALQPKTATLLLDFIYNFFKR